MICMTRSCKHRATKSWIYKNNFETKEKEALSLSCHNDETFFFYFSFTKIVAKGMSKAEMILKVLLFSSQFNFLMFCIANEYHRKNAPYIHL